MWSDLMNKILDINSANVSATEILFPFLFPFLFVLYRMQSEVLLFKELIKYTGKELNPANPMPRQLQILRLWAYDWI